MKNHPSPGRAGQFINRGIATVCGALLFALTVQAGAGERQVLRGHVPHAVADLNLQPLEGLAGTNRLNLAIALPLRNKEALTNLLQQVCDPTSPNFRRYLTPEEFTEKFGPTEEDYQKVLAFAREHHLTVTATAPNRMVLDVAASTTEIEAALHLGLHVYQHPQENRTFYAPDTEPSLDLAVPVLGISGLENYALPRPRYKPSLAGGQPGATRATGSGTGGTYMGNDFRAAYVPDSTLNGAGQSVGLLQFDGYTPSDIAYYESKAGLPSVTLSNVLLDGFNGRPSGSGGEVEVSLDIEMSLSMAPGLSQILVYMAGPAGNWHDILNRMATDNLAKQLSCSWYIPGGKADPVADQIFQQMAAQGQSFFNASGDADAYAGLIDFPGDTPYITQVGGTTLTTTGPGGAWVSEKVWNWGNGTGSGGGISTQYPIPSWQTNVDMTASQGSPIRRNMPDVALTADNVYVRADGKDNAVGGTSCAAPLWAGFTALINQAARANGEPVVGLINPAVYALGQSADFTTSFHDITVGNNESTTSPTKFVAVPGYDLCTGWGTPAGGKLIYALGVPEPLRITPGSGALFTGPIGGPLVPSVQTYTLTNNGVGALDWKLTRNVTWLTVTPTNGTLTAGGPATDVIIKPNALASNLPPGSYTGTLWFTNLNNGFGQSRQVNLAIVTPPLITLQPASQAVFQGMAANFTVGTASNALLYYQWQFDNGMYLTNLTDGGNITGSTTGTLTVSNVSPANVGAYSVMVSNAAGSASSATAFLTIVPWRPVITAQPVSQTVLPGAPATFSVAAVGSQPFVYHWRQNGTNLVDNGIITGSGTSTLLINNATPANLGTYSVVLSNGLGTATSSGAALALISVTAPGAILDTVYSFAGPGDGANPYAGLVQAKDGNFYGTALNGGATGFGTLFRLSAGGSVSLLHSFTAGGDGANPYAVLSPGTNGNLYGAAFTGTTSGYGTIFSITTNGSFTSLSAFNYTSTGAFPVGGVTQGRDGNWYGPTLEGGLSGYGTLFRMAPGGALTVLRAFNGENAAYSSSLLLQSADGNFYGTGENGGTNGGWGTVFRMTPSGNVAALASFGYTNGGNPVAGLAQDADGTFYGTAYSGGTNGAGAVFKMTADGDLSLLHSFTGNADGANPFGGVVLSSDGNFYGTTEGGGAYGLGTLYRISPTGVFATLAHFDGYQGANPECTLVQGTDGNLYGTAANGGQGNQGAIFRLSISAPLQITMQPQTQMAFLGDTVRFCVATFGSLPVSYQWRKNGKNIADSGNLSGSTARILTLANIGVTDAAIYSVVVSNASGTVTSANALLEVLVSPPYIVSGPESQTLLVGATAMFSVDAGGDEPLGFQWQKNGTNLVDGGNLFGAATSVLTITNVSTTNSGIYSVIVSNDLEAISSDGALLTVVPAVAPGSSLSTLRSFTGTSGGLNPYAGLIQGKDGFFYGTTLNGGSYSYGMAYRLNSSGTLTLLHSFTDGLDGANPYAGLVQGLDGNLYGAAFGAGASFDGSVFKMTTAGATTTLYSFLGDDDGSGPAANLVQGADGILYGTANAGGADGYGTVFCIATNGTFAPLASFTLDNGAYPQAPLVQATNGLWYGTAYSGGPNGYGTVFSVNTNGQLTTLVAFNYVNGAYPAAGLVQASDGFLYGTTSTGGPAGSGGTVFRMAADGTFSTLHSFNSTDGAAPFAGLLQGIDGALYGTTSEGGVGGRGTVFRMSTAGSLTTLVWFSGLNGANPLAPLIQARDGIFYGTTAYGGVGYNSAAGTGDGLVFRLILPTFLSNPFNQVTATVGVPYSGSLASNVVRPPGDSLAFAKVGGAAWLNLAADGTLSGTPTAQDIGTNNFAVSIADPNGWSCAATMRITVLASPRITAALVREGANLRLTWSGRTAPYQVQMATSAAHPAWTTISGPLNTNSLLLSPASASAFYRIQGQ